MIKRRRFLTICAAAVASPSLAAAPLRWHGIALGAHASLELHGPPPVTRPALKAALQAIQTIEALFSLYAPRSALSALNAEGTFPTPDPEMLHLFHIADRVHKLTKGRFDPTVQAAWPDGTDLSPVGWDRVRFDSTAITIDPGQALTFNGIAQGFATDMATQALRAAGLANVHVNVGEQVVHGPSRRLELVDPTHGSIGTVTVKDTAIATSSPAATPTGMQGHILSPLGETAQWATVSVLADKAALADGLSTGLCHAPLADVEKVRSTQGVQAIILVDPQGDARRL